MLGRWKAYYKLAEHLDVDDILHYLVNHRNNFVDPENGSQTQTIERLWSHLKDFLPVRGMKPRDLIIASKGNLMFSYTF